jgi:hypothetical protein
MKEERGAKSQNTIINRITRLVAQREYKILCPPQQINIVSPLHPYFFDFWRGDSSECLV